MKKILFSLAACFCCLMANAQTDQPNPTISVNPVYAQKGEEVTFTINLQGGRVNVYEAFQFEFDFPTGFSTTGTYSSNWPNVGSIEVTNYGAGVISSNYIPTADLDNLLSVELKVDASVENGIYPVTLKNITLAYNKNRQDVIDSYTFNVIVSDVYTLDENSQTAPKESSTPGTVKVIRSLKANEWSTICLPLDLTEAQVNDIFGEGTQLAYFYDYKATKNGNDVTNIDIEFTPAEVDEDGYLFYAGTPYIIKTTNNISEFSIDNLVIDYLELTATDSNTTTGTGSRKKPIGKFIGTYVAKTVIPEKSLFLSGNKFWYSKGLTKMKAFRAYFTFNDVLVDYTSDSSSRLSFYLNDGDGLTKIDVVDFLPNDGEYYNLNGLRVETPSKGIYIKNGKKVVVK